MNLKISKPMAMAVFLFLLYVCVGIVSALPHPDKIIKLPGQPQVGFQQFSGYVTVDDKKQRSLFYYFVEAETDPASKPLVLWLNGGPGCSSLGVGAFSENGPFRPRGKGLVKNEHSWNKEANMLYLESPIGVGFSYSSDTSSYETVNDEITGIFATPKLCCSDSLFENSYWYMSDPSKVVQFLSNHMSVASVLESPSNIALKDNVVFLLRWFHKFPQYRKSNLFLTGESYAGHYVPQLAKLMMAFNKKQQLFNLKGIALGNPVLEFATDFNSRAEYFWSHGLISDPTYRMFSSGCNYSRYVSEYYRDTVSPICSRVMSLVSRETSKFVDKYDVTLDVCISSVLSQSKIISPQENAEKLDVCVEDEVVNYLNRKDVRRTLHAELVGVRRWSVCSSILDYQLLDIEIPTISIIGMLVKERIPVLIYSGDQDSVVPLIGSRQTVQQLARQMQLNTTVPYRVWFAGQQVGGWTHVYDNILSFATIRGASHEAPFSQPERSLVLFKSFLEGKPLPEVF